jgi:hypothetical protein
MGGAECEMQDSRVGVCVGHVHVHGEAAVQTKFAHSTHIGWHRRHIVSTVGCKHGSTDNWAANNPGFREVGHQLCIGAAAALPRHNCSL